MLVREMGMVVMSALPPPGAWDLDPVVVGVALAAAAGYAAVIGPWRARLGIIEEDRRKRVIYFAVGWLTLVLALVSPLDTLGRYYLFSAHTIQLLVITTLSAPFLLLGLPERLVELLLPLRALREATRALLFPVIAAAAFNIIVIVWHVGPLYEQGLRDNATHDLESLSLLVAGVLTWWPLLTPLERHGRMARPFQMLYLMLESLPLDIFGVAAIFALGPFYPTYVAAPRVIPALSASADQALAGALLAVPGNILDTILLSVVFFTWIGRMERAQREHERALYAEVDAQP